MKGRAMRQMDRDKKGMISGTARELALQRYSHHAQVARVRPAPAVEGSIHNVSSIRQ
jgi:hypothetical protein